MRAVTYHDYGCPDVLSVEERPVPSRKAGQVLIRVAASGINPIDYRMRQGEMRYLLPGGFPRIPGFDVAGWVEEIDETGSFSPGDRVLAFLDSLRGGGYAEYSVASASSVVKIPESLDFVPAAGLPLAGSTALQSLREIAEVGAGDTVLINGASGGVGSLAVQIAKTLGAEVTGVAGGQHLDFVRQLGADETIDYQTTELMSLNREWKVVFDVAGKLSYRAACKLLVAGGTFISTEPSARGFLLGLVTLFASKKGRVILVRSRARDLKALVEMIERGQLSVPVDDVFPLADAAVAHRRLQSGGVCGKLVLRVAPNTNSSTNSSTNPE